MKREVYEHDTHIEETEIFRLSSQGGIEFRYRPHLPFVRIALDGVHNSSGGEALFDAYGLRRLGTYIIRYADRLEANHLGYNSGLRKMVAGDLA